MHPHPAAPCCQLFPASGPLLLKLGGALAGPAVPLSRPHGLHAFPGAVGVGLLLPPTTSTFTSRPCRPGLGVGLAEDGLSPTAPRRARGSQHPAPPAPPTCAPEAVLGLGGQCPV